MKVLSALLLLAFSSSLFAAELTLMFIRSPEIDWTSPRSLANSTVNSMTKTYGLGHVNVRVKCSDREIYTGIYNRYSDDTRNAVLRKGQGLGVLFNLFEGTLQKQKFITPSYEKMSQEKRTNFVTFKVSPGTCQRLLSYYDQYERLMKQRQSLPRKKKEPLTEKQQIFYGFPAIPRMGEGGGCSAFAISFLEVAGLKEEWMVKEWSQELLVPQMSVGLPLRDERVSLTSMLLSSPKRWAQINEPHYPLYFWDPDLMFKSTELKLKDPKYQTLSMFQTSGIVLDRTRIPTPTEPIFFNDPFKDPSDPRKVYTDLNELLERYELSREASFAPDSPIALLLD